MGRRNTKKGSVSDTQEIDRDRLRERFKDSPHCKIADLQCRSRTKLSGEIKRISIRPRNGIPAVEIVISDGTDQVTVIFSGRRNIPGIYLGRCLVVDGVAYQGSHRIVIMNPAYTLLA